jgi:H/ACA ribonucleoprotein complex non-core subunit NAF1
MDRDNGYAAEQAAEFGGELVSVDDLQVAAAAAAAAMGESSSEEETSSSSEEDSSSDEDDGDSSSGSISSSEDEATEPAPADQGDINYLAAINENAQSEEESEEEGSDLDSDDDEDIVEIHSYEDLRRVVDQMESGGGRFGGDGGDEDGGHGFGGTGPSASEALFGNVPIPLLDNINITSDDSITLAGTVLSIIEGTVVVRAAPGSRALNEGSILVLEDRTIIGTVEDIFGPVQAPLYALRYIKTEKPKIVEEEEEEEEEAKMVVEGEEKIDEQLVGGDEKLEKEEHGAVPVPTQPDAAVATDTTTAISKQEILPESKVYSVDHLADFVAEEKLRVKGYDGDLADEAAIAAGGVGGTTPGLLIDPEQEFSDDEAEAQYKRKLKAKRKANATGAAAAAAGAQASPTDGGEIAANKQPSRQRNMNNFSGNTASFGRGRGGRGGGRDGGGGGRGGGRGRGGPYQSNNNNTYGNYQQYPQQQQQQQFPPQHYMHQGGYPGPGGYPQQQQQHLPPPPPYAFPQGGGGGGYYPPQGPPPPPGHHHPHFHPGQPQGGPPQYLGQYYAQGAPQYYPPHPHQQRPMGGGQQQFQANATAGQFGAISLQPHHVHPGYPGGPPGGPRPPFPQGGAAGEAPRPYPPPPQ